MSEEAPKVKVKVIRAASPRALRKDEVLEVGKTYDMSEQDANRWIRRGVVEAVEKGKKSETANEPKTDSAAGNKPGHSGGGKGPSPA